MLTSAALSKKMFLKASDGSSSPGKYSSVTSIATCTAAWMA
jgi:hypothetical protein